MPSISVDMWALYEMDMDTSEQKEFLRDTIKEIQKGLNPHSKKSIQEHLNLYGIVVEDAKIETLNEAFQALEQDTEAWELVFAIMEYLKLHFFHKNYISCFVKHATEEKGNLVLPLNEINGVYWMPNKQKLFHTPLMWEIVTHTDPSFLSREIALQQHNQEGEGNGSNF